MSKPDPGAFFREMLGQWESIANQFGSELMKTGEFARTVQGATTAGLRAKEAAREAMSRALEAANMPSREDMIDMTARLRGVEARLERIETLLARIVGESAAPGPDRPRPKRTKKPPKKD
jgi:hypothetical protein